MINRLQIGDWYQRYAEGIYYPYQITKEDFACDDTTIYNFKPIPLTKEILEKNGFIKDMTNNLAWDYFLFKSKEYVVYVNLRTTCDKKEVMYIDNLGYRGKNLCLGGLNIHTLYVHELQHALRLCGLNELADNLKLI